MSTNISKQKREDLLNKIKAIRAFISATPQDENTGNLLSYLSDLEKDVNGKKYGLVFEEHREEIDEVLDTHTPVLTEDKDLFIDNGEQMNFLIEGDNLASLKLLEKTHKSKIDLIYIDPPYNTLNDGFTYSDTLVDGNDTFRHSKWLSFMRERLNLARRLMSYKGIIFISVDENEFAQIKLLCDEIFSERNFIECIIWNKRVPKNDKGIGNIHEYILTYAKSSDFKYKFMVLKDGLKDIEDLLYECKKNNVSIEETEARLKKLYKKNKYDRAITLYNAVDENYRAWGKINMSWPNGNTFGPRYDVIHPITKKPVRVPDRGWRWNEASFLAAVDYENIIERFDGSFMCGNIWFSKDENMQPSSIKYLDDVNRMLLRSIISLKSDGGIELEKYFDKKSIFAYPKSVELLRMLVDSITYNNQDCTVLDFFAGSGTTGHAVMKLNAEDGGNRKFILCTNNENNICRNVTYERIKRVIEKENYPASLKYYKVEYIPISDRLYYEYAVELLKHIRELVELENGVNFTGNAEIAIVLTEEELDDFVSQLENNTKCQKLYLGHDILMDAQQAQVLKDRKITINIIPDYYYKELEG
ncbi:site-specific DNA-methyltransferase [Luxibacter massiliensis]|uniref:site-specific DNA-methyltransferase n=1 Tax=Luxibacter massiliensis TaxID=2219695 RepID=UPI0013DEFAA1|nr:site-specific DNA-methyltransferase [Luxibacter massiliensis]